MIKLIVGLKGSGKTKNLIEMVNSATETSDGVVICLEKGEKLRYDISFRCRLINTSEYAINNVDEFRGFVSGLIASNGDITDIFVDSALKICGDNVDSLSTFIEMISPLINSNNINLIMTASIQESELPENLLKFI